MGGGATPPMLWCPGWQSGCARLATPLKGFENEIEPLEPRVETRGYVPAPTRGAGALPPLSDEMCVIRWVSSLGRGVWATGAEAVRVRAVAG